MRAERVKVHLVFSALLCIAGCTPPEERQQVELMDAIEKAIRLPPDAGTLARFARVYKFASSDRVIGFYFVPDDEPDEQFCQDTKMGGRTNGQIALACPPPEGMTADERRWFANDVHLPRVSDGGCYYIDVEYDLKRNVVTSARCHGEG